MSPLQIAFFGFSLTLLLAPPIGNERVMKLALTEEADLFSQDLLFPQSFTAQNRFGLRWDTRVPRTVVEQLIRARSSFEIAKSSGFFFVSGR